MNLLISACGPRQIPGPPFATASQTPIYTPQPGLIIHGNIQLENGQGLADVKIYRAFASYGGVLVATTKPTSDYRSELQFIPGDEMIRVWAELPGYVFDAEKGSSEQGVFFLRHYYGLEDRELNFVARPTSG